MTQITDSRALPILVAYNIPNRDCSGYSGGGVPSPVAGAWWPDYALGLAQRASY